MALLSPGQFIVFPSNIGTEMLCNADIDFGWLKSTVSEVFGQSQEDA